MMEVLKLDEATVLRGLRKAPVSVSELMTKMGFKGASSASRLRVILAKLVETRKAATSLRRGQRGRPATTYARV